MRDPDTDADVPSERELVEALLDVLTVGVLVTDGTGTVIRTNPVAERMLGRSSEGMVGRPITAIRRELEPMLWPTEFGEILLLSERPGGEPMIVGFSTREVLRRADHAVACGHVIAFSDLTEAKGMQREESHRQRLADLGGIVATLAHEIRNPVFAISSLATLLGDEPRIAANGDLHDLAVRIRDEAARISRLVDDVLGFSRRRELRRAPVDIVELITGLLNDLERTQGRENDPVPLRLVVTAPPGSRLDEWNLDHDAIRQVVSNLVRNAVQAVEASDRVGPDRQVELFLDVDDSGLRLEIVDRGVGMDSRTASRIFDSFFSTRRHGTGLGMSVALKLVRQHNGSISVSSELGKGTTVTVRLPR